MRRAAIAALLVLMAGPAAARHAAPPYLWGDKACADAEVRARVVHIGYESVRSSDPRFIIMDGLYRYRVRVTRVMFGPIARGEMEILLFAHAPAIYEGRAYAFYLQRRDGNTWDIADCRTR